MQDLPIPKTSMILLACVGLSRQKALGNHRIFLLLYNREKFHDAQDEPVKAAPRTKHLGVPAQVFLEQRREKKILKPVRMFC